jgi:endonuclease YncB( thermonuclease family)
MTVLALTLAAVAISPSAGALDKRPLIGTASVIDGDTIEIHGQHIRFYGIDAPESRQNCNDARGKLYRCGQKAALALADKIGRRTVRCDPRDMDRYGRTVAVYRIGKIDLNGWMVSQGLAVSYRRYAHDYDAAEAEARARAKGIWAGRFVMPRDWRRGDRIGRSGESAVSTAAKRSDRCKIKGNISRQGKRIFHVPSDRFYGRTKVDIDKGERWFCSEDEARSAGWRPAKR